MRTCAIVNPIAGRGRTTQLWPDLEPHLRAASTSFTARWTTGPGTGEQLTRNALRDGIERVVAVGGDGTLNEVVNGFFDDGSPINPEAVLSHIPCGSGSDFRRTLGVPVGLPAADQLTSDRIDPLDVIRVECARENGEMTAHYVINIASWGLSGTVVRRTSNSDRVLPPRLHYLAAALRALATTRPMRVELTLDGDPVDSSPLRLGAVANGHTFAAGLQIAPSATPRDGLFDLILLNDVSVPLLLRHIHHFYRGTHTTRSFVSTYRGRRLTVEPLEQRRAVWMEGDGEILGCLPATFEMLPEAVRVQY